MSSDAVLARGRIGFGGGWTGTNGLGTNWREWLCLEREFTCFIFWDGGRYLVVALLFMVRMSRTGRSAPNSF